jgi:hypothetical protein
MLALVIVGQADFWDLYKPIITTPAPSQKRKKERMMIHNFLTLSPIDFLVIFCVLPLMLND